MHRTIVIGAGIILCSSLVNLGPAAPAQPAGPASRPGLRIGVYDSRCVALARFRSETFQKELTQVKEKAKAAQKSGDTPAFEKLKKQIENEQERIHAQVFSDTPIGEILAAYPDVLARVAAQQGVAAVVPSADYLAPDAQKVDITDALITEFKPSAKTRKTIDEIRRVKPVPIEDLAVIKD